MITINDFYTDEQWQKFMLAADQQHASGESTPFLLVDLAHIQRNYQQMVGFFPQAKIYYAMKANPGKPVIDCLNQLGAHFDCASIYELDRVLECGVSADRISYGNTIKKAQHIQYAYDQGVRLFASDSKRDLEHIAEYAAGSKVFIRILVQGGESADWPLSRKFGCHPDMAIDLLVRTKTLGLDPYGISFHVGSQQRDIAVWDDALSRVKYMFDWMRHEEDITLRMINMGGGFPARYLRENNPIQVYADEILRYLQEDHHDNMPEIILEPGRSLVGDAGILVSEVVLISRKSRTDITRWVYTDVGMFQGLIETMGEAIRYPIYTPKMATDDEQGTVILAGPTCDSADIMYENSDYRLPQSLAIGDRIYWFSTGAYTTSYSSVEFNGFPPLKTIYLD